MDNIVIMSERPFQIVALMSFLLGILFGVRVVLDYLTPFKLMESVSNGLILNSIVIGTFLLLAVLCMIGEFTLRSFNNLRQMPKYIVKTILKKEEYQTALFKTEGLQG